MRIISPFKDYYDSVAKYGIDPNITYLRNPIDWQSKEPPVPMLKTGVNWLFYSDKIKWFKPFVIGFCGKLYPAIQTFYDYHSTIDSSDKIYDRERIFSALGERHKKDTDFSLRKRRHNIAEWFTALDTFDSRSLFGPDKPIFVVERDSSILHSGNYNIKWNTRLNVYEFFRVYDSALAFQKLSIYLGGLANPEKSIPTISNNDMIEAKGFDLKSSFRKDKSVRTQLHRKN